MSDTENDTHKSHETYVDDSRKESLAIGKGATDVISHNHPRLIPESTPGREAPIKPRSPYRNFTRENGRPPSTRSTFRSHHDFNPEDSVRVEEADNSTVRSVFEINQSSNHGIFSSGTVENTPPYHQSPPMYYPGNLPPPPPGYSYQPPLYPISQPAEPEIPDYDKMSPEDQKEARIIFKSKFASMKESYPELALAEYDLDIPLHTIHKLYEQNLKKINVKTNSMYTRAIITLIFMGIEAFSIKVLNIDISGYAERQVAMMDRYDNLLIEIGEKYTGSGGNWPVEARLFLFAIFNAFLIVGVKMLAKGLGWANEDGILNTINGIIGGHVDSFVEKKPEPKVDPVTKTTEVPVDHGRNLMGGVENLMALAGNTFGVKTTDAGGKTDIATTLSSLGSRFMPKPKKDCDHQNDKEDSSDPPRSKRGVRFGSRE